MYSCMQFILIFIYFYNIFLLATLKIIKVLFQSCYCQNNYYSYTIYLLFASLLRCNFVFLNEIFYYKNYFKYFIQYQPLYNVLSTDRFNVLSTLYQRSCAHWEQSNCQFQINQLIFIAIYPRLQIELHFPEYFRLPDTLYLFQIFLKELVFTHRYYR